MKTLSEKINEALNINESSISMLKKIVSKLKFNDSKLIMDLFSRRLDLSEYAEECGADMDVPERVEEDWENFLLTYYKGCDKIRLKKGWTNEDYDNVIEFRKKANLTSKDNGFILSVDSDPEDVYVYINFKNKFLLTDELTTLYPQFEKECRYAAVY